MMLTRSRFKQWLALKREMAVATHAGLDKKEAEDYGFKLVNPQFRERAE
jgi:hypothetical protein